MSYSENNTNNNRYPHHRMASSDISSLHSNLNMACKTNNVDKVNRILGNLGDTFEKIQGYSDFVSIDVSSFMGAITSSFTLACARDHVEIVKLFVNSSELEKLKTHPRFKGLHFNYYTPNSIQSACSFGNTNIVKYLFNSLMKNNLRFYFEGVNPLKHACVGENVGLVKYLLTDPEVSEFTAINFNREKKCEALETACQHGNLEVVKYLLTSPDLKEKANPHIANDAPFRTALTSNEMEVIEYFIFEYGIKQTESIRDLNDPEIESMFQVRELNKSLSSNKYSSKKVKI